MRPESFWQEILPPQSVVAAGYPARFDDGRILALPIRPLPDGQHALASLIINQASFAVVDALASDLASKLERFDVEVIIGLPTLGLTVASAVAQKLGHTRYVPLGTSEKYWYSTRLSVPLRSITTPQQAKRLFVDPRLVPLLDGRRVALIDDVISSGASMLAGVELLSLCQVAPVVLGAAMLQSDRWRQELSQWPVVSVIESPILTLTSA